MLFVVSDRMSDSPFVERIWRAHSLRSGTFLSVAATHCEMVVTRHNGRTTLTLRGPETRATPLDCPADAEWVGIRLGPGTFMPRHPTATLIDHRDVTLPEASRRSFWLEGSQWEFPDFENAETFVERLARAGLIAHDPAVAAALRGELASRSMRTLQRRFLRATGMTQSTYRTIERARYAATLLRQGMSIADVVHEAGYYDQPHLTRSLRTLIGETPATIVRAERQLSLLYKTEPLPWSTFPAEPPT
jgi:AraC-like DNA-binding protein